jgi:hypothetical protein
MVLRGQIHNGVVILEGEVKLPEGTQVEVKPLDTPASPVEDDPMYRLGELAVSTGIPDLARNIDHYLYGHPRKDHAE